MSKLIVAQEQDVQVALVSDRAADIPWFLTFLPSHARTPLRGSLMATQPSTLGDDGLIARRYQEEIFEKAVHGNIIAALDTGSGKTLISTLLIKWISTQGHAHKKLVVFLVPKVALAQQQGAFITKHLPLRVKQATGATAPDMSDRIGWQELFSGVDVIVLTGEFAPSYGSRVTNCLPLAQLFLNVITHSHWTINKVRGFSQVFASLEFWA